MRVEWKRFWTVKYFVMKIQVTNNFDRRLQVPTDTSNMIKDTEGRTA